MLVGRANLTNFWNPVFISRITRTTTNTETSPSIARLRIAYFIVFCKNSKVKETVLLSCLRDTGMNTSVTRINRWMKSV